MTLWKAYVESQPWRKRRCLHLSRQTPRGAYSVVKMLTLETIEDGRCTPESDGILGDLSHETDDLLRAIMDAAWEVGIRPTKFQDHTNELTAVRYHLEDMRQLVGKGLTR